MEHLTEEPKATLNKKPWQMTFDERKAIEVPIKVPSEDTVYIFRATGEDEVKAILAGKPSGKFWGSRGGYPGDYTIIAKSNKRYISWEFVLEHQPQFGTTFVKEGGGFGTKWEDNPDFTEKATIYNNHFEEVGGSRLLGDIVAILDNNDNIIYLAPKANGKEHLT